MSRGLLTLSTLMHCRSLEFCPDAPLKPAERAQAVFQKFDILHECTRFDAAKLISRRTAQTQAQDEGQPSRGPTQTICQDTRGLQPPSSLYNLLSLSSSPRSPRRGSPSTPFSPSPRSSARLFSLSLELLSALPGAALPPLPLLLSALLGADLRPIPLLPLRAPRRGSTSPPYPSLRAPWRGSTSSPFPLSALLSAALPPLPIFLLRAPQRGSTSSPSPPSPRFFMHSFLLSLSALRGEALPPLPPLLRAFRAPRRPHKR